MVSVGLGMLAVGLGIGAAVASTPGVASADTSADPFSRIAGLDPGDLSAAATPAPSTLDFQISINGTDLFPTAGNTATAISGTGDIAIADGGFGDVAFAEGLAGGPTPGATGNNFDFAIDTGGGSADAGNFGGAPDTTGSSFDYASAIGNNTTSTINPTEAVAGGGLSDLGGSNDTAFVIDPSGTVGSTADAGLGFNSDPAAVFGDAFNAIATGADNLFDILGLS